MLNTDMTLPALLRQQAIKIELRRVQLQARQSVAFVVLGRACKAGGTLLAADPQFQRLKTRASWFKQSLSGSAPRQHNVLDAHLSRHDGAAFKPQARIKARDLRHQRAVKLGVVRKCGRRARPIQKRFKP